MPHPGDREGEQMPPSVAQEGGWAQVELTDAIS